MATGLHIATNLTLPQEAVTQTFAILAKRGVGKTYTAAVMAEEMLKLSLPVVITDPIGVWWGLRAAADGKAEGLPIIVLGGDHGDVPIDVAAGEIIADMVVDERLSAVLDLSRFRKGEQTRFMQDFCERLYHRNREALHLVLDEADAFAPQRPMPGQQRLLGAVEDLVRRGRARGIGVTLVTQRAAVLNKDVLTQVEVLVALRTIAPQDRNAVDEWIKIHGTPEQRAELLQSLASLPVGTAWFWSPGWLDMFRRVEVRRRETFDSSATPKVGATRQEPKRLAAVDLEKLRGRIASTVEKAKANDPRELRRRIAELEAALRKAQQAPAPLADNERQQAYQTGFRAGEKAKGERVMALIEKAVAASRSASVLIGEVATAINWTPGQHGNIPAESAAMVAPLRPAAPPRPTPPTGPGSGMPAGERKILTALAQYPAGRTKVQVAILTGYAHNGGGFNNYLSSLRGKGWLEGSGDNLRITDMGRVALGAFDPLPAGRELRAYWLGQVGKAEREVLEVLCSVYPGALSKEECAARTPTRYEPSGGGFNNALSRLRTLELITGRGELRASEDLF